MTESLELDAEAMIDKVEELCRRDPSWQQRGAVALNNPHNATGRVFSEEAVRKLITYCLEHGIYFIDDLAYQNVAPVDDLPEIKTVRQIASELVWLGVADEHHADRVITVHSMSKTDCLAGARLAVVEIRDRQLRQRFEEIKRSDPAQYRRHFYLLSVLSRYDAGRTDLLAPAQCDLQRTDTRPTDSRGKSPAGSQSVRTGHYPADRKHVSAAAH